MLGFRLCYRHRIHFLSIVYRIGPCSHARTMVSGLLKAALWVFETGLSAREAYFEGIHCPSAKGIDEATLHSACKVSYEGSRDAKRKTIEVATEKELLRPPKVIGTCLSLLQARLSLLQARLSMLQVQFVWTTDSDLGF